MDPRPAETPFEREVQLRGDAALPMMVDPAHKPGVEVRRAEQLQECLPRIHAGDNASGEDMFAAGELHAAGDVVFDDDAGDG